jgi:uncharacterized protein
MSNLTAILNQPRFQEIQALCRSSASPDPAHDYSHSLRVLANAHALWKIEGGDLEVLAAAAFLHDIGNLPKNHPDSKMSSTRSSERAAKLLAAMGFSATQLTAAQDAILCHSFSRGLTPQTHEGRLFQDADRLDALGAIGIARTYAVGGSTHRPLYCHDDPFCREGRKADDKTNTLDHFFVKLMELEKTFLTESGRNIAKQRTAAMGLFLDQLNQELSF